MKRIACSLSFVTMALTAANASANQITEDMITDAQSRWAQGIVSIGEAKLSNQDYAAYAEKMISELYDYEKYGVLFKPTKAKSDQFRETFEEAHSYFVTGVVNEDNGFAINPWTNVRFDNHDILVMDDIALAMGNDFFTTINNKEVKVEYTFGYRLDESGDVKIVLHHSSLPFNG